MSATFDHTWIWHPSFSEDEKDTSGRFVHFRRHLQLSGDNIPRSLKIQISADTKYKLYVNRQLVCFGPVKGDQHLWFYDEADIAPYLVEGTNHVGVHVLRFFHSTQYAPSFPRLATGGLRIVAPEPWNDLVGTSALWETAIDPFGRLRVDDPEDVFLHIYERHTRVDADCPLDWVAAKVLELKNSTGNSPPWHLSPRMIPTYRFQKMQFSELHHLQSDVDFDQWKRVLLSPKQNSNRHGNSLRLAPGTRHQFDLEVPHHTTGFLRARFQRPAIGGGHVKLTYAESYEDDPDLYKGERRKAHRRDLTRKLLGPHDIYYLQGSTNFAGPGYHDEETEEHFAPFHWRTFRFIRVEMKVGPTELVFAGLDVESATYPLDVSASTTASRDRSDTSAHDAFVRQLWETSVRTLENCMHDCYEDCPFYEQLQYAMDTRSSAIFTYCISGDDRMARQAMVQMHNSFQSRLGLTTSRAPTHRPQFIPTFSLYWICTLCDHHAYFGDRDFLLPFLAVVDGVLSYFGARVDAHLGLVKMDFSPGGGVWNFVDWTQEWKPYGFPASCERTGFSTFTNAIYAYTLKAAADLLVALGRPALAQEYRTRSAAVVSALKEHCFDGDFFTDSLASEDADGAPGARSVHSQIWAVLCGASAGPDAQDLLRRSISQANKGSFVRESIAMSFYTMRALSVAGGDVYDEHFHAFWQPWRDQLELGLTTWVEDSVAQRSDCHAWGSVALYDFVAEVAGVRPAAPCWQAITVQPRLGLYSAFEATVPLSVVKGQSLGSVHVSWTTCPDTENVQLTVRGSLTGSTPVSLKIKVAGLDLTTEWKGQEMSLVVGTRK